MTKQEFLSILKQELDCFPRAEQRKTITYYEELIEDRMEDGMTEEEAVEGIGNPRVLAEEIINDNLELMVQQKLPMSRGMKVGIGILLILGSPLWASLLAAGFLCILSVYIIVWVLPLIGASLVVAFGLSGIYGVISFPFALMDGITIGIVHLGIGICSIGLTILCTLTTAWLSKKIIMITARFTKWLVRCFRRRGVLS